MKRYPPVTNALVLSVVLGGILAFLSVNSVAAADEPSLLQIDNEFVQAAAKDDKAAVGKLLDMDFTWTDADGKTRARADVLKSLPTLALATESRPHLKPRTSGQVDPAISA